MDYRQNIRNFSIIAHIDHGKSTLSDRFLEMTKTVAIDKMRPQYLDMMDLEREKGITIKMQPVRMLHTAGPNDYILNLIDTPGHVDFSYEVSRALAAVEGTVLLVDATKGIQAQTIANLEFAKKQNLFIIPVINKIDSPQARIEETKNEIIELLNVQGQDILAISAKAGTNIDQLLKLIIEKIPAPKGEIEKPLRALIFDSKYDSFLGVIAYVRVVDGKISTGDKISLIQGKYNGDAKEVGYFHPKLDPAKELRAGEIGYIATGIKEPGKVRVGDTITTFRIKSEILNLEPLHGYKEPKPMVFASLYPEEPKDFDVLRDGLVKLRLNDSSFSFEPESREFLGRGFRCGFLGTLHTEIICERLYREFGLKLVISAPSVLFQIINKKGNEVFIKSASDWPEAMDIEESKEPWVKLEIMAPASYLGKTMEALETLTGQYVETKYFGQDRTLLTYEVPLREIVLGFYDKLKSATQGFASMNYEFLGYRKADLVKLEIAVAGKKEEAFAKIVLENQAFHEGGRIVKKLKDVLPPQMFAVALQAVISGKVVARETISAKRRDVIAPLYGGDYTRKRKLLEQQKKGKKELKSKADIQIPAKVFLEMLKD